MIPPGPEPGQDEALDAGVDASLEYGPVLSDFRWVVGGRRPPSGPIPGTVRIDRSNCNVALGYHEARLFMAFRTASRHFASARALMHVLSSTDMGRTWEREFTVAMGTDVREPSFLAIGGRFFLFFVQLGRNPAAFDPRHTWQIERHAHGHWSERKGWGVPGEVLWEVKVRNGRAWSTSYHGNHYGFGASRISVELKTSADGMSWTAERSPIYVGGVSEVGFEFDRQGQLWGVTRNEDGDVSGFGSHVVRAPAADPWAWGRAGELRPGALRLPAHVQAWERPVSDRPARHRRSILEQGQGQVRHAVVLFVPPQTHGLVSARS